MSSSRKYQGAGGLRIAWPVLHSVGCSAQQHITEIAKRYVGTGDGYLPSRECVPEDVTGLEIFWPGCSLVPSDMALIAQTGCLLVKRSADTSLIEPHANRFGCSYWDMKCG